MHIYFDGTPPAYLKEYLKKFNIAPSDIIHNNSIYYPTGKNASKNLKFNIGAERFNSFAQIPGQRYLTNKKLLWKSILQYHGREKALEFLPETYILHNSNDQSRLHELKNQKLILKGNLEARKSLKIIDSKNINQYLNKDSFDIAQKIIQTDQSISKRPFNLRLYIILSIENGKLKTHLYQNAKFIYGQKDEIITYNSIPSHKNEPNFLNELSNQNLAAKVIDQSLQIIRKCIEGIVSQLDINPGINNNQLHQLIGLDIIIDNNQEIKLIEANWQPAMKASSRKDQQIKEKVLKNYYNLFKGIKLPSTWIMVY